MGVPRVFDWLVNLTLLVGWLLVVSGRHQLARNSHRLSRCRDATRSTSHAALAIPIHDLCGCLSVRENRASTGVFADFCFQHLLFLRPEQVGLSIRTYGWAAVRLGCIESVWAWRLAERRTTGHCGFWNAPCRIAYRDWTIAVSNTPAGGSSRLLHAPRLTSSVRTLEPKSLFGRSLWNVHFSVLVLLLFVLAPARVPSWSIFRVRNGQHTANSADRYAAAKIPQNCRSKAFFPRCGLSPVLCLPVVERWGYWDHWLSWSLYAPHSSRVKVEVADHGVERLPESLKSLTPQSKKPNSGL